MEKEKIKEKYFSTRIMGKLLLVKQLLQGFLSMFRREQVDQ